MEYAPSERQVKFRELAYQLYENGIVFKRDWCVASRDISAFAGQPVTLFEAQGWDKEQGYSEWFYSVFPPRIGPDEAELALMDWQFYRGVSSGMHDGKEWAFKLYKSARWGNEDAKKKSSSDADLAEFLGVKAPASANRWKVGNIAEA